MAELISATDRQDDADLLVKRLGFHGQDAVKAPLGGANLVDDADFDGVGGLETVYVFLPEVVEIFGVFAVKEEKLGKQAVTQSVLRGTLFPFRGNRPVGLGGVVVPDADLVRRAVGARGVYSIHFYDGMIVAAAERAGCERLWSEDLNAGQRYFGVTVENHFDDGGWIAVTRGSYT